MSRSGAPNGEPSVPEIDEIVCTVDDIAEGAGEMAALATMMCAPVPIQKSLITGSVNRHGDSSAQCTLENLRSILQRFPTLSSKLVSACLGEDISGNLFRTKTKNGKALSTTLFLLFCVYRGFSLSDSMIYQSCQSI